MAKHAGKLVDQISKDDPIVKFEGKGVELLQQKSKPIIQVDEEMVELVERMGEIMYDANGVGLAAPQVGILKRLFVYDVGDGLQAIINPKIMQMKGEQLGVEGCLSIPGLQGEVLRANEVVVKGLDQYGKPVRIRGEGLTARVIQHENDHLDGIMFTTRAEEGTLRWVEPGEEEDEDDLPQTRE